jgi:hypothetical protein
MVSSSLPVFAHPDFPQVFSAALQQFTQGAQPGSLFPQCDYSNEHCDCREAATVIHLPTDLGFCMTHYRKVVGRG